MDGTGTFSFWQHVLNVVVVARAGLRLGLELELKLGCDAIRCDAGAELKLQQQGRRGDVRRCEAREEGRGGMANR